MCCIDLAFAHFLMMMISRTPAQQNPRRFHINPAFDIKFKSVLLLAFKDTALDNTAYINPDVDAQEQAVITN